MTSVSSCKLTSDHSSVPYALRLVFDEPKDGDNDALEEDDDFGGIPASRAALGR